MSRAAAESALADARAALHGRAGHPTRDATLALVQLRRAMPSLTGAEQAEAKQLGSRPATTESVCTTNNCYHWNDTGADAVPQTDANANGVPDYVDQVASVVDHVRQTYVGAGYRAPEPDGTKGGDSRTDIYLADVGAQGLYGYCTSDQPVPSGNGPYDAYAFCVLDNDYAGFPRTPLANIEVTAAHEYFHAVQFAYDAFEDPWFMEATATWAEDELYTDVNDNLQYLPDSPLALPGLPLDTFADGGGPQYGEWIFFRYLTERVSTTSVGGLPTLVRDMWRRADGSAVGPDDYSMQAVEHVLKARGFDLTKVFASFAAANRFPTKYYSEGKANHYPVARPAGTFTLKSSKKDSTWLGAKIGHLSAITARFVAGRGLSARTWKLRVSVDLPNKALHPAAVVSVLSRSGRVAQTMLPINTKGNATKTFAFGSSGVKYVEVTLVDAGRRYTCWTPTGAYSCHGDSRDDGQQMLVRAVAVR
jgi:hypothetical protein